MNLALKIINNKLHFFEMNNRRKIKEIIKIYNNKVDIKEFLKLRNEYKQKVF